MSVALPPVTTTHSNERSSSARQFVRSVADPRTLYSWGFKSAVSMMDQGLTSGVGLVVNLFLARWLAATNYGAFALAFAIFLFIAGIHNALLLEPLTVMGPSEYRQRLPAYIAAQIKLHGILVGCLSAATLVGLAVTFFLFPKTPLVPAVLGAALALPFLLLAWILRRICYVMGKPATAVIGSSTYFVFAIGGLLCLRHWDFLSACSAFLVLGVASSLATLAMAWQLRLLSQMSKSEASINWRLALKENWRYGRWLLGSPVLYAAANQVQIFLVAGILGLGAAGVLRAMQLPSLVMTQIIAGTGPLILSSLSQDFGSGRVNQLRHKATVTSIVLGITSACFAAVLAITAMPAEKLLFGGKYSEFARLIPLLALMPVANAFAHGFSMALRALQRPQFDLLANGIAAPLGVASAGVLTVLWGLPGAALSMVVSAIAICIVTTVYYGKFSRQTRQVNGAV